ncbi:Methylthioribulose-1-phosphate dehydratase-like [Homarus americanus]|uniref:Methylthioribulose-1-phosphate dehydratase-like n=1 Tax=Homarus americanus TaxID=6706 RepID=A0A8J5N524_HOMAM|nr:Methylthioribulose-1-phosphate dehydratase-like [Homarus americanus]
MSEEDNSEVSRYKEDEEEEEEEVITPKRRRGRPRKRSANTEETGSEAPDTDSTPLRSKRERKKKTISFGNDSGSDDEVIYHLPEKRRKKPGRQKGHTLTSGTWVAKKPLGRPKLSYYESSRRSKKSPSELICELGQVFYNLGWVSGTGGGISIKDGDHIYVAPSGVQKERLKPEDMFVLNMDGEELDSPHPERNLKKSQCTPLFMLAYKIRGAGAVIHSHSKAAVLATLAFPGSEFKVTQLEMIKALEHYPDTNAVLVRRHGVYVWGDTWEKAKTMAESYDYLFDVAVQMTKFGLDPSKPAEEVKMAQVNGK